MTKLDARGYACPMPVVMAQRTLKTEKDGLEVLVDNRAAVENLSRFATANGFTPETSSVGTDFKVVFVKK